MILLTPPLSRWTTGLLLAVTFGSPNASAQLGCEPTIDLDVELGTLQLHVLDPLAIPVRVSLRSDGAQISPIGGGRNNSHGDLSPDGNLAAWVTEARSVVLGQPNTIGHQIYLRDIAAQTTVLVSEAQVGTSQGKPATGNSCLPRFAGDGLILFQSTANDLVAGDVNDEQDVFQWVRSTGAITLLSKRVDDGALGNGNSHGVSGSDDGRFAVFTSKATNLMSTAGATHPYSDCPSFQLPPGHTASKVYLLDQGGGATAPSMTLLSVGRDAQGNCAVPVGGSSTGASISANGCRVAFESTADNLLANQTVTGTQIYVWERETGALRLVSHQHLSPGVESLGLSGPAKSSKPCISADGRWVAYVSNGVNLLPGQELENDDEIFVVDLEGDPTTEQVTFRITLNPDGIPIESGGGFRGPTISPDGRWVSLTTGNDDYAVLGGLTSQNITDILLHDRDADADGVYDEPFPDSETQFLCLEDPSIGQDTFSNGYGAPLPRFSRIVTDGNATEQWVLFESEADNMNAGLVPVDDNAGLCTDCGRDIYVRRLWRTEP